MAKINQLKFFNQPAFFSNIKEQVDALLKDRTSYLGIRLSIGLILLMLIINAVFWIKLPPQIPLFYSRPWGEDQLAGKNWIFFLTFICLFLIIMNFRLASLFYKNEILLAKILVWTSVILAFLLDTTLIRILIIII